MVKEMKRYLVEMFGIFIYVVDVVCLLNCIIYNDDKCFDEIL